MRAESIAFWFTQPFTQNWRKDCTFKTGRCKCTPMRPTWPSLSIWPSIHLVPTAPLRAKGPIASLSVPELRSKLQDPEELQRLEFTDALLARRAVWEYETFIPRVDRRLGVNNNFFTGPGENL